MMGQQQGVQEKLFYAFNLEEHNPQDHLLREIDRFLDLGDLPQHLAEFYSHTGRPSSRDSLRGFAHLGLLATLLQSFLNCGLLFRDPLRATFVRRGASQPCLPEQAGRLPDHAHQV